MRQRFAHLQAALAVPLEGEGRRHVAGAFAFFVKLAARLFTGVREERRLRIERIEVGWPAVQEKKHEAFRLRRKVRNARRRDSSRRARADETRETEHSEAGAHAAEHLPTV